jgi:4a-hydroxytetrahydrobiopterin dehydratase
VALADKSCRSCREGAPCLSAGELALFLPELPGWSFVSAQAGDAASVERIERDFKFASYAAALRFVNQAAEIAEQEDHHPELTLSWGHVLVRLWTHTARGVTEADVILAAKYQRVIEP